MNTIKTLFKKTIERKNNKGLLKHKQCDCTHCDKITCEKMKKCDECHKHKVCKECYYEGKILCKDCDNELIKQYEGMMEDNKNVSVDFYGEL